jgi:hypothetical protein
MAAVYARFKGQGGSWRYEKVGKGRPPKEASFHVRFTDATGKRRWSTPFKSVEDANANSEGVKIASEAAAKGLTVAEFQDTLNTGRTTVKDAVEAFLKLKKRKRLKAINLYTDVLNHFVEHLPKGVRFVGDLATADALDEYLEVLEHEGFGKKTIHTRMGVVFSSMREALPPPLAQDCCNLVAALRDQSAPDSALAWAELWKLRNNTSTT